MAAAIIKPGKLTVGSNPLYTLVYTRITCNELDCIALYTKLTLHYKYKWRLP